jgi:hypothetical protein
MRTNNQINQLMYYHFTLDAKSFKQKFEELVAELEGAPKADDEKPAEEKPVEEKPAEEKPAEEKPAEEASSEAKSE